MIYYKIIVHGYIEFIAKDGDKYYIVDSKNGKKLGWIPTIIDLERIKKLKQIDIVDIIMEYKSATSIKR